ncbi:TPA: hypothetical protein QCY38_003642 [Bacillus toyonensis]|nr:hypothetical protein [Bacillus toyonensis]
MDTLLSEMGHTSEDLDNSTPNMVHRFALLDSFLSEMEHHILIPSGHSRN